MNKQIELNREYWVRVVDMCQGTALEGREWECVKIGGKSGFIDHPCFDGSGYDLAVAVVEDKAVFYEDELYLKDGGARMFWQTKSLMKTLDPNIWTWQKPEPKRIFLLNGVELPCPVKRHEGDWHIRINDKIYWFETKNDVELVRNTIATLLNSARDKQ